MESIINFETFLLASILLNITPGADTMYILGRSITQGKKAGVISALGISSGAICHCLFATLGLSVLLAKSAMAFSIVKYLGATYLMYLGVRALLSKSKNALTIDNTIEKNGGYIGIYISGILTNLLNPKVALFFLAFIPQFIAPGSVNSMFPFLVLGITFITTGTLWCLLLALFSARLSERFKRSQKMTFWLQKSMGAIFIFLGIKIALQKSSI